MTFGVDIGTVYALVAFANGAIAAGTRGGWVALYSLDKSWAVFAPILSVPTNQTAMAHCARTA